MRSAEASGVRADDVGASEERADSPRRRSRPSPLDLARAAQRLRSRFGVLAMAVGLTSFAAAGFFVVFDCIRTVEENRGRLDLVARSLSAEINLLSAEQAALSLLTVGDRFDQQMQARLIEEARAGLEPETSMAELGAGSDPGLVVLADAGSAGQLAVSMAWGDALGGIWPRGFAVFAVAALVTGLSTMRRASPAERAQAWEAFESLISTLPVGIACWDREGRLVVSNEEYQARLAIDVPDLAPGASYPSVVKHISLGGYMRMISNDDSSRVLEFYRQDRSCLMIEERPLPAGGFVTLVSDVTERKRSDQQLSAIREEQRQLARRYHEEKIRAEAASRSKTSFLRHLSHDIRTPLNHIIGFADLIRHQTYGPLGDSRYLGYIDTIKGSGERLLASFATILEYAELEGGQKTLREDPIEVDTLVRSVAERFRSQAGRAGISLVVGAACGASLMADEFSLQRMLGNIMENAIRFTPSGGKVSLAAYAASDGVVIEISDTGLGMDEERLASLSQPFVLGDAFFTREHGGPGLGIAIARTIAELSGGHLAIDSSPTLGTTVAISLPLREIEAAQAAE